MFSNVTAGTQLGLSLLHRARRERQIAEEYAKYPELRAFSVRYARNARILERQGKLRIQRAQRGLSGK